MELKNYFRQIPVSFLIKYDKYEDTVPCPASKAARLISGKNAIGTVTVYARVTRVLVFDLFIFLSSDMTECCGIYVQKDNQSPQAQTSRRPDPYTRQPFLYRASRARNANEPSRGR